MRLQSISSFLLIFLSVPLLLTACAGNDSKPLPEQETPEMLYQKASKAMDNESYRLATTLFEEVERQHPYSDLATQAQLMSAYSSYKDSRYDEAVMALDRFIELHPGSDRIDYAYYLKALSYYEQISDVRRDQYTTEEALQALEALIRRFPNSDYKRDAVLKRDLAMDHLAGKEMEVGRYYLARNQINAALNRFRTVVTDFQTTTHVPEALHRLVEGYLTLGIKDEAVRIAAVLGYNYPGNIWYERSYNLLDDAKLQKMIDERSFVDRTVDSIFKPN